jgi:hypothetical protein
MKPEISAFKEWQLSATLKIYLTGNNVDVIQNLPIVRSPASFATAECFVQSDVAEIVYIVKSYVFLSLWFFFICVKDTAPHYVTFASILYFVDLHLDVILVNDQLDALFSMYLFHASTCFEQQVLIIRRIKLCQYIIWYNTL